MVDGWKSAFTREGTTRHEPTSSAHQAEPCDDSVRCDLRQSGAIGFQSRRAPLEGPAREKQVGLVSCDLRTLHQRPRPLLHLGASSFHEPQAHAGCTAMALRRTVSACVCNVHLVLVDGLHSSALSSFLSTGAVEKNLRAISACCSQADTTAPAQSFNHLPVAVDICCTLAHSATSPIHEHTGRDPRLQQVRPWPASAKGHKSVPHVLAVPGLTFVDVRVRPKEGATTLCVLCFH